MALWKELVLLLFKKIIAIVISLIGVYAYLQRYDYEELKAKATDKEKKALGKIEGIAILLPLIAAAFIVAE